MPHVDYFVTKFDHITAFQVLYQLTSVKGGAHTCYVDGLASLLLICNHDTQHAKQERHVQRGTE